MEKDAKIGRSNWITGLSTSSFSKHFKHQTNRRAELILRESAAITKHHHLDCTNFIEIGKFSTIAGYYSQFLTHSIDLTESRQDSSPIIVGQFSFIGTNVTILGGSTLPPHCVLGAKSLLNKKYSDEWNIYAGVPAKAVGLISKEAKYFTRSVGFVY